MKNVLLTFVAASLAASAAFAGGLPNKEKVELQVSKMQRLNFSCNESQLSTKLNTVLACENQEGIVRLFVVKYSSTSTGSRCGNKIVAESVTEI